MLGLTKDDKEITKSLNLLISKTTKNLDNFKLGIAADDLYQFLWHDFADVYIENCKLVLSGAEGFQISNFKLNETDKLTKLSVLRHVYLTCLKLLHPFMPFVTEEIWQIFTPYRQKNNPLIISPWPTSK